MQANSNEAAVWLTPVVVVGFLVVFPLFWIFVCWLIALIGGWRRLAQHYRVSGRPAGRSHFVRFAMVGMASYRMVLTITVTPDGLHLAVMPLFRPGHPPLLIPWRALRNPQPWLFRGWPAMRFEVLGPDRKQPLTKLVLPPQIVAEMPAAIRPSASEPTPADDPIRRGWR